MRSIIFIFSLPRSGSTWLQRLLASNPSINSTSESWLLLPVFEALFKGRMLTEYNQQIARRAQDEFFETTGIDRSLLQDEIAQAYWRVMEIAAGEGFFLEKTPRNHLILDSLIKFFPDAKFLFLWRDPAEVALSLARSYAGRWNTLFRYEIDFRVGIPNLVKASRDLGDRACIIQLTDLKEQPARVLDRIYDHIGLEDGVYEESELGVERTTGVYGDKTFLGGADRGPISRGQRATILRTLNRISEVDYAAMGYDKHTSMEKIRRQSVKVFEIRDIATPLLTWAYNNGLASTLLRWRGDQMDYPEYGVE